jgi:O-antigen/teichoic acid export membrane protein
VEVWQVIPETYMRNVFPILARAEHLEDRESSRRLAGRSAHYLLLASLPLAAGMFFAARPIVSALYGPGFETSAVIVRLLALYIPLSFSFELLWRLLVARNEQHLMLRAQVIAAVLRLTAGFALISYFSAVGAGISALLITLEHNLLLRWYLWRRGGVLQLGTSAFRLVPALAAMSLATWYLADRWPLWLVVPVSASAYAIGAWITGVVPLPSKEDAGEAGEPEIREELVRSNS